MKRSTFQKIDSWEQTEQQDIHYYRSLTPAKRLEIARELIQRVHGPESEWPDLRSEPPEKITSYD